MESLTSEQATQRNHQEEIKDFFFEASLKEIASKIIDGISKLNFDFERSSQRWIWELIQNAKDCAIPDKKLSIEIECQKNFLEFRHSGRPFTMRDLVYLTRQTSGKDRERKDHNGFQQQSNSDQNRVSDNCGIQGSSIGKFGTGFLTTHMLSRIITISGLFQCNQSLENNDFQKQLKYFRIVLDRSSDNLSELISQYKKVVQKFQMIQNDDKEYPFVEAQNRENSCDTKFRFKLESADSQRVAQIGLQSLRDHAGQVLIFNPQIQSIKIGEEVYEITQIERLNEYILKVYVQEGLQQVFYLLCEDQGVQILVKYEIEGINKRLPDINLGAKSIFNNFPLIANHDLRLPFYLNSSNFITNEERSGLIVEHDDSAFGNQLLLNLSIEIYASLMDYLIDKQYLDLYNLAYIHISKENQNYGLYMENLIKPMIMMIRTKRIFLDRNSFKVSPSQIIVPAIHNLYESLNQNSLMELYNLIDELKQSNLVEKNQKVIQTILTLNQSLEGVQLLQPSNIYDISQVLQIIQEASTITDIAYSNFSNDKAKTINWLNDVYSYIKRNCTLDRIIAITSHKKIFPNEHGEFHNSQQLYENFDIEDTYVNILQRLGLNLKSKFLHKDINQQCLDFRKLSFCDIEKLIIEVLKGKQTCINGDPSFCLSPNDKNQFDKIQKEFFSLVPDINKLEKMSNENWVDADQQDENKKIQELIKYRKRLINLVQSLRDFKLLSINEICLVENYSEKIFQLIDKNVFKKLNEFLEQQRTVQSLEAVLKGRTSKWIRDYYYLLFDFARSIPVNEDTTLDQYSYLNQEGEFIKYSQVLQIDTTFNEEEQKLSKSKVEKLKKIVILKIQHKLKTVLLDKSLNKIVLQNKRLISFAEFSLEQLSSKVMKYLCMINEIAELKEQNLEIIEIFEDVYDSAKQNLLQDILFQGYEKIRSDLIFYLYSKGKFKDHFNQIVSNKKTVEIVDQIFTLSQVQIEQVNNYIQKLQKCSAHDFKSNDKLNNLMELDTEDKTGERSDSDDERFLQQKNKGAKEFTFGSHSQNYIDAQSIFKPNISKNSLRSNFSKVGVQKDHQNGHYSRSKYACTCRDMRLQEWPNISSAQEYMIQKNLPLQDRQFWEIFFEKIPIQQPIQPGYVYILQQLDEVGTDIYKVGYSEDVNLRMAYLYKNNNKEYELIEKYESKYYKFFEDMIKKRLVRFNNRKDSKENGYTEWYKLPIEQLKNYIKEIAIAIYEVHNDDSLKSIFDQKNQSKVNEEEKYNEKQELSNEQSQSFLDLEANYVEKPLDHQIIENVLSQTNLDLELQDLIQENEEMQEPSQQNQEQQQNQLTQVYNCRSMNENVQIKQEEELVDLSSIDIEFQTLILQQFSQDNRYAQSSILLGKRQRDLTSGYNQVSTQLDQKRSSLNQLGWVNSDKDNNEEAKKQVDKKQSLNQNYSCKNNSKARKNQNNSSEIKWCRYKTGLQLYCAGCGNNTKFEIKHCSDTIRCQKCRSKRKWYCKDCSFYYKDNISSKQ
ncbi:UNKNOWN [Stylonychia lemnae]|uniref:Bacteriophage T5 Orf172 DNA-binding domain-containing protein n=1 Tax=Stylonychia lemnae TaxID=5949 RepID=A0A078B6Y7_STYLE|nr:UNKNOWN [Stylonychia lemnae]|eukprot:CDW89067.1 UNKNOWN [Stylonychia lemnae]